MKINNLQGGYSKWNTVILSDEHSSAGSASYSEKPSPELLIKLGSNELRAEVTQGDFANGGGTIFYNGERIGNWFGKIPGRLTVMDTRRITILRLEEDDWSRRFKWAYRNGFSWRQAWRYASWGYLLIGKNYALASIIDPHFNWEFAASHPPFNEEDHQMVCSLPPQEQLLVLFVVLRRFGGLFRGDIKRGFGNTSPNVRSFIRIDKGGQPCLTLDPGKLPLREEDLPQNRRMDGNRSSHLLDVHCHMLILGHLWAWKRNSGRRDNIQHGVCWLYHRKPFDVFTPCQGHIMYSGC